MDIVAHKRTLGILHIVFGAFLSIVFVFVGSLISILYPFIADEIGNEVGRNGEDLFLLVTSIIRTVFILLIIFSALPSIIAGIGLLSKKSWGPLLALIAGCICIFSFPFGTALGVYSIYVFVENNKIANDEDKG